jgi:Zn-finger nucleic acid-binding protein
MGVLKHGARIADSALVEPADPTCPACRIDMEPAFYEEAMIWACPKCRGSFMPRDTLQAITANESAPRSDLEHLAAMDAASTKLPLLDLIRSAIPCPNCREPMTRAVFDGNSGIGVDECASCGIWLDPGELARAEAWREARRAGLRPDPK